MNHPLHDVINQADGFLLIGESKAGRFPALSFHAYTQAGKRFYALDLDGMTESRGMTKGARVYTSLDELPAERGDLAIIWVLPKTAVRAVELAHQAGCTRVWLSFQTAESQAVARARELGMTVVEIGRCPVYYLDDQPGACKAHTLLTRVSGTLNRPPQTEVATPRRELW